MKKIAFVLVALVAWSALSPAGAVPHLGDVPTPDNRIVAVGGTQLSNGIFIPGTAQCTRDGCEVLIEGSELEVEKGQNVTFTNLDAYEHANAHSLVSIKTHKKGKKKGKPLFSSSDVKGPAEVNVRTKHLKPGSYPFYCRTHFGMYGIFKIVKPQ